MILEHTKSENSLGKIFLSTDENVRLPVHIDLLFSKNLITTCADIKRNKTPIFTSLVNRNPLWHHQLLALSL